MKGLRLGLAACVGLVGCSAGPGVDIAAEVMPSVVLITYGDQRGNGSGFFVEGAPEVCTVLTANHVVQASQLLLITTDDSADRGQPWRAEQILPFPNGTDLALVTFRPAGNRCPYRALKLGNSDQVRQLDRLFAVGYPIREGEQQFVKQVSGLDVSSVNPPLPNGYGISFTGTTAGGMSGGPVLDQRGRVVGVHAKTDYAVVELASTLQSSALSSEQQQAIANVSNRIQTQRVEHFKWAVPIKLFKDNLAAVLAAAPPLSDGAALRQQGWQHWETKNLSAMLAVFEQAIQANGQDSEAWFGKGFTLSQLGRNEEALASYDKALAINPDYAIAWINRGIALSDLGRHEEALASYDQALAINPDDATAWSGRGAALHDLGRKEEALASYDQALAINPDDAIAWRNRGIVLSDLGRNEEALASYDKALAINPDFADAWSGRGAALHDLGRLEESLASFDKALAINPDYAFAWNGRGAALRNLGRPEEALASYDKSLAINPDNVFAWHAFAWNGRGIVLSDLGRNEEALASYDKALAINPDFADAWYNRGVTLSVLGRPEEALASYDKAVAINPEYDAAWNNKAYIFVQQGRYQEALAAVEKALAINPNNENAQQRKQEILSKL